MHPTHTGGPLTRFLSLVVVSIMSMTHVANALGVEYGFTAFPYDFSLDAVRKTHEIILPNSNLYAIHLDQCLPWKEALEGKPFPKWLRNDWNDVSSRIPKDHSVYVAVTPTQTDRRSLAEQCGSSEDSPRKPPAEIVGKSYRDPLVQQAYFNYVKRVVEQFKPKYINIGIEMSELALQHPDEWPAFADLYLNTRKRLKESFPKLWVGMEFVLQSLMKPSVASLAKPVVDQSDYIGISFYPYGSAFGEKFGAPKLPSTASGKQWKEPLEWLKRYTDKPIGICETGYTSDTVHLNIAGGIDFPGSPELQKRFLRDLVDYAKRDHYAFVVWFIAIDYDAMLKVFGDSPAVEWKKIWVHAGLFDKNLKPKPAWSEWQRFKQP